MAKLPASPALIEMLQASGELDRILSGAGLQFERPVALGPPPKPARPFIIPAPDWAQEESERKAAEQEQERQQRETILAEELERLAREERAALPGEEAPAYPPPPQPRPGGHAVTVTVWGEAGGPVRTPRTATATAD
jgi:hypothetical protein